ncbi:protein RRP6-like 3 isoform X2 [Andrographis paniculata]|uniref:protein RRP6-like 3 isoform X2 n=1 Tax=Andrographis paniculata TaxID=175694 RepID=UPI0021E96824|nr:protein RRP6-like 3 isoform X2 [Andrographis paniculata]
MAMDNDKLRDLALAIAATCFFAIVISIRLIKPFLINPKRKKRECYLNKQTKPQSAFKRVLADNSYSQFKHLKFVTEELPSDGEYTNLHPYKGEISKLMKNRNVGFLEVLNGCDKWGLEMQNSYVWVDTESELRELVEVLTNERVFAVDTEQHSFRSFLGFTALIQISTVKEDYLVDTIMLHDKMLLLRPVFADPEKCKVFHGADNDVLWLQRDYHIYVVNLFDTAKACDVLSKPQRSLAYLLETYCSVSTNKLLQREDWRQRPLPEEMIQYARIDAHYLLYIAYCLCQELMEKKDENSPPGDKLHFLLEASRRSNATCLQLYAKEIEACPGELAASSIISRCLNDQGNISSNFSDTKELVRRLCLWRDITARLHDESLRFVLSDNAIIALAAKVPANETDIFSLISKADQDVEFTVLVPSQSPSPVIFCHLEDLQCLLQANTDNSDNIFEHFIEQHLSPAGSCPLSAFNYNLLSKTNFRLTNKSTSNRNGFRASKHITKKASRDLFVKKFSCKSPVYHNCKIYANDGRLLCYCDRRKLEWYINRNLAKLVEEDPPSIMLLFEPKGRPEDEDNDFYIQSKKNICVGCGEGKHYLRYRIIPSCYRMHFPEHMKSHRSHDIVLLCVDCHEIAHAAAEKYKRQIADEFGIPLFVRKVVDSSKSQEVPASSLLVTSSEENGVSPLQLRTAAMALLRHGPQMPAQRHKELMQVVKAYYGGREILNEDLERALVVGMSPHERKRFEKKRGYTFKHFTRGIIQNHGKGNNINNKAPISIENVLQEDCEGISKEECMGVNLLPLSSGSEANAAKYTGGDDDFREDLKIPNGDVSTSENLSNGTAPVHVRDTLLKHEKLSLLGHGPHGKQVVEHLLKEYGEDGIREFCQRWRQVFVEALHPRFLPGGWDVMHSGKRDFGEFSVYKPGKKAALMT